MADHLRYQKETVNARTSNGQKALELLDLNAPDLTAAREASIAIEISLTAQLAQCASVKKKILNQLKAKTIAQATAQADLTALQTLVSRLQFALDALHGKP